MKKEIHPKYEKTTIECACGNKIETRSTVAGVQKVELCSACHPFYTGKQKFVDTAGRVDKFRARMEAAQKKQTETPKKEEKDETTEQETPKTAAEKVADVVNELENEVAPGQVTGEMTSDVELAAADELADDMAEHKATEDNQ